MQQQNTATKGSDIQATENNSQVSAPDPKKNSGLNSDQDTVVNEEDQDNITNGTEKDDKEKSFHKNELPDNDDVATDDDLPRIGDDPGEMERISPKM